VSGPILGGCPLAVVAAEARPNVSGETFSVCHHVRDGHAFPRATEYRSHDIVIVGGGMSGLTAAHVLRDRDVLLLDKEPIWGGNARLQEHGDLTCSVGSAFIGLTDTAGQFARELGVKPLPIANWDGTIVQGRFTPDTWGAGLDELPYPCAVRQQFKALRRDLLVFDKKDHGGRFDKLTLETVLKPYGAEVLAWWNAYCPSNWGGTAGETDATLAVEELCWMSRPERADTRATWPGGLGVLAQRLAELVRAQLTDRMIERATVVGIKTEKDRVRIDYLRGHVVTSVEAKAAIVATPQYISNRLVSGLPPEQVAAMKQIRHVPYAVVNLLFDRQVLDVGYDTWCPGKRFTDVVAANWVEKQRGTDQNSPSILTCYVPLKEADRSSVLDEDWCRKLASDVLADFQSLMPELDIDPVEVHLFRRGHAVHLALPGLNRHQKLARRSFGRIAFANADIQDLGASTSGAIRSARRAVEEIERFL